MGGSRERGAASAGLSGHARALLESREDAVLCLDREGCCAFANAPAEEMLGYGSGGLAGVGACYLVRGFGHSSVGENGAALVPLRSGRKHHGTGEALRGDGRRIAVEWSSVPVVEDGEVEGAVVTLVDLDSRRSAERSAEERLRESEERYRALYDNNPSMYFTLDERGTVLSVNRYGAGRLGYAAEELVGTPVLDVFHEEDREEAARCLGACLREPGWVSRWELRKVRRDGSVLWVEEAARRVWQPGGEPVVLVVCEDITHRRRNEEALHLSQLAISASSNGIIICDAGSKDLPIVYANESFERITGYTAGEALGRNCRFLQGEETQQPVLEDVRAALREGRDCKVVLRNYRKDGTPFWNELYLSPVRDGSGRVTNFIGVQNDITERKNAEESLREAEETYRSIFENSAEGIFQSTPEGRVVRANPALARLFGFESPRQLISISSNREGQLYAAPEHWEEFVRRVERDGDAASIESEIRRRDGGVRRVSVRARALRDEGGELRGYEGIIRDVTEKRRGEAALREIRETERRRIARDLHDGALQDLIYTMHAMEVTKIKCERSGLPAELSAELEEEIESLQSSLYGLRDAVHNLRQEPPAESCFVRLLESMVELERQRFSGAAVELAVEEGFPHKVTGKPGTELLRIVQEALVNARRHSGAQHVRVALTSEAEEVRVEVADDGRGFEPALARGIGLCAMRERASNLYGRLDVHSEPGQGTRVEFRASAGGLRE
ncbi:MAG: PAS domain S-box protein [Rubrobacter sp.]|nr:PAS domain S-box protein [Rubrobacter sp.]